MRDDVPQNNFQKRSTTTPLHESIRNYKQHEVDWFRASDLTSDYIYKILDRKQGKDKFLYVGQSSSMGVTKSKQKRQQIIQDKIIPETTKKAKDTSLLGGCPLMTQVVEQAKLGLM